MPRLITTSVVVLLVTAAAPVQGQDLSVDEVRRLLPEAIGLEADNWLAIGRAPNPPTPASYRQFRLTSMFMLHHWLQEPSGGAGFRFLCDPLPSPAQIAPSFERSIDRGFVSFVQGEDLCDVKLTKDGQRSRGTCRFVVKGFYEGELRFVAEREGLRWAITRVDLPALGLRTARVDGRWLGAQGLLNHSSLRRELSFAFMPRIDQSTFDSWKRPGARPEVAALPSPSPGTALLTRSCVPIDGRWKFYGSPSPPTLDRFQAVLARNATLVAPNELTRVTLTHGGKEVTEVEATKEVRDVDGTFVIKVDGLMEGEGRFEARFVSPDFLPAGLEGAWVLRAVELPGLGWRFELKDDNASWRVVSLPKRTQK